MRKHNGFKAITRTVLCLLCTLLIAGTVQTAAEDARTPAALAEEILDAQLAAAHVMTAEGFLTGSAVRNAGGTADWYILALAHTNLSEGSTARYGGALLRVIEDKGEKIPGATMQRYVLALRAAGIRTDLYDTVIDRTVRDDQIMTVIFGLHLFRAGCTSEALTYRELVEILLGMQLPDGGFAVSGESADVDVTAMAVGALAPIAVNDPSLSPALERAVACLSRCQLPDGGFESWGTKNAESCAQVILALRAAGIDVFSDERFIKNGSTLLDALLRYRTAAGEYAHTEDGGANAMATAEAFCALTALENENEVFDFYGFPARAALDPIYPADIETQPQERTSAPLWRILIAGVLLAEEIAFIVMKKRRGETGIPFWITVVLLILTVAIFAYFLLSGSVFAPAENPAGEPTGTVTIRVRADEIVKAGYELPDGIPADGILIPETATPIRAGSTVWDVLDSACRHAGIEIGTDGIILGNTSAVYVREIMGIGEFDYGATSGWCYTVSGASPAMSCGSFRLSDGDVIDFYYKLK